MQADGGGGAPTVVVYLAVSQSSLPVYKRALMTGVNLYMARALLRERLTGPLVLERSLWAAAFAFVFAPHPAPLMADHHRLLPREPGYWQALALHLTRTALFEMATLAYVADGAPLGHIVRLYGQGAALVNPIARRALRLLSCHAAYSLSLWRIGKPSPLKYAVDTLRILQGLYWERALQLQSFALPDLTRVGLCAATSFALEAALGQSGASPSVRRRAAFLVLSFLTRAFIFDTAPMGLLFSTWFSLQIRQLVRETGLPSLARLLLLRSQPALPLGLAAKPEDNCAFCLEELGHGQVVVLPCGHSHHTDPSEMRWTDTNRRCPICSAPVKLQQEPRWKQWAWAVANFDDKDRPAWYGALRAAHAILDGMLLRSWWWIAECDFAPLE